MQFSKNLIRYYCTTTNRTSESVWDLLRKTTNIDQIGAIEQLLFSFPLNGRTIYENIKQAYKLDEGHKHSLSVVWGPDLGKYIGTGNTSYAELRDCIMHLIDEIRSLSSEKNDKIVVPLSGGLDSRFLADCVKESNGVESFTYHSGPSTELYVAKIISARYRIKHRAIEINPKIYIKPELFQKHLGMVQHYHAALVDSMTSMADQNEKSKVLMLHGFMGDPIFGSKAAMARRIGRDEACEAYLERALKRYPFFATAITRVFRDAILEDLYMDHTHFNASDSASSLDEILFLTRRQQMIYKIVDCIADICDVSTPFCSSYDLARIAISLPQRERIDRNAFIRLMRQENIITTRITSENPLGVNTRLANLVRKTSNSIQYFIELFNPNNKLSPYQHEQLRASIFFNQNYFDENIKSLQNLMNMDIDWKKSLNRSLNAIDFPYSCVTINAALQLIDNSTKEASACVDIL